MDSARVPPVMRMIYDVSWIFQHFEAPEGSSERSASEIYKFMLPLRRERECIYFTVKYIGIADAIASSLAIKYTHA